MADPDIAFKGKGRPTQNINHVNWTCFNSNIKVLWSTCLQDKLLITESKLSEKVENDINILVG